MKKLITLILAIPLIIAAPSSATFVLTPIGYPSEEDSWTQRFQESGVNFDLVAIKMFSAGDSFVSPALSNFSDVSWALLYENTPPTPTLASASGMTVNLLQADIEFAGSMMGNPLSFSLVVFDGETLAGGADVTWGAPGWHITAGTWYPSRSDVPEPATICLLGLGALSLLRRKR